MRNSFRAFVCLFLMCLTGCGPSVKQVVEEHRPAFGKLREKLKRISAQATEGGSDSTVARPLDPPLLFMIDAGERSNTEILMFEHLTSDDPKPAFDLLLSNNLTFCLFWTSDQNTSSSSGDSSHMRKTFEQAQSVRYLVVHRVTRLEQPVAIDDERYTPGHARIEGYVFDLPSEELLAQYSVEAQSAPSLEYSRREDESRQQRMADFAQSTMWEDARSQIEKKLSAATGGTVQFKRE